MKNRILEVLARVDTYLHKGQTDFMLTDLQEEVEEIIKTVEEFDNE